MPEEKSLEKKALRKKMLEIRDEMSWESRLACSREALRQLKEVMEFKEADTVYMYLSFGSEMDTGPLLEYCFQAGKRVAVPKADKENKTMEFYYITPDTRLEAGCYGIREPSGGSAAREKGVMILPGVAFDRENHRLGYGGGFYDRYLSRYPAGYFYKIALLYPFQLLEEIPTGELDKKADRLIIAGFPA